MNFFGLLWEYRTEQKKRQAILDREAEKVRNAKAKANGGYTTDQVHYFDTVAELDAWTIGQRDRAQRMRTSLLVRSMGGEMCRVRGVNGHNLLCVAVCCCGAVQPLLTGVIRSRFNHWRTLIHIYKNLKSEQPDHLRNATYVALACSWSRCLLNDCC